MKKATLEIVSLFISQPETILDFVFTLWPMMRLQRVNIVNTCNNNTTTCTKKHLMLIIGLKQANVLKNLTILAISSLSVGRYS